MGIKVPCYNCENRQYGCHSVCAKYLEYRDQIDSRNKKIDNARFYEGLSVERTERVKKITAKRHRK